MTRRVTKTGDLYQYMEFNLVTLADSYARTFVTAQDCQDWIETNRPGQLVEWRVSQ